MIKKVFNWIDADDKGLQDLMMNQIYTAVLGSIIYMLFDWIYNIITTKLYPDDVFMRGLILLIVIIFYLADLYYIKYSNPYRRWYFLFDLVFLACMLCTVKTLNLESKLGVENLSDPELKSITFFFLLFLLLYLIWDCRDSYYTTNKKYYILVITWEVVSIIFLSISYFVPNSFFLLAILSISTISFCYISIRKRKIKLETEKVK